MRLRRFGRVVISVFLIVLIIGWWRVLRIVEHDSWPPPSDAVTAEQSLEMTTLFVARDDVQRDDVAIPYAPSYASDVDLYLNGSAFFPEMLKDMESAQSSIHIIMFAFAPGDIGDQFEDVLTRKAEAGVEVRLVTDQAGSKPTGMHKDMYDRLSASGVQIVVNNTFPLQSVGELPNRDYTFSQDQVGRSDHRKMMVIDGRVGWVGGAGFEDHFATGAWLDTFSRVEGDVVRQLQAVFCTSFYAYGGDIGPDLARYFPEPAVGGDIRVTVLQNIPGGFVPGTQASREMIEESEGTLDVLNPYFTDEGMLGRVIDASERGVDVRVITSRDSNAFPAQYALNSQYSRMLDAGIEIWEVPGVLHAKVSVSDSTVVIGSINYDAWSLYRNLEMSLMFEDSGVVAQARSQIVEPVLMDAEPGVPPEGWQESVPADIWWWLRYFM